MDCGNPETRCSAGQDNKSPPYPGLLMIFNVTRILGLVLLVVISSTAYFARLRRLSTWFHLHLTWIMYCITGLLNLGHQSGPEPPFSLCLFQAMMIPSTAALTMCACLTFSIELYQLVAYALQGRLIKATFRLWLFVIPYVAHFIVSVLVLVIGLKTPAIITRQHNLMFCRIESRIPVIVSSSVTACATMVAFFYIGLTARLLHRNWHATALFNLKHDMQIRAMFIRFSIFSVWPAAALVVSILTICAGQKAFEAESNKSSVLDVSEGFAPLFFAVIFGTQTDILRSWVFWKKS
ncbi:hypothetical protein HGRIS_000394 [Hohenbuehelia grisea]|uniref:Integral membrane protein n=1 Tax=Hohenbuehelia grisea TaxID=104357 RepID=A0ABR3JSH7_9AGAR